MKQIILILFLLAGINSVLNAQELKEIEGKYFLNGQLYSGEWSTFFENGSLKMHARFKNGLKNGKTKIFFEDGQLNEIRSYKKNEMHGKWIMYNNHNVKISIAKNKIHIK